MHYLIQYWCAAFPSLRNTSDICNSAKAHLGIPSCLSADREKWYYSMSNFASEILNFLFGNVSVFLILPVTFILMVNNTCLVFHPCFYPFFPLSVLFISPLL